MRHRRKSSASSSSFSSSFPYSDFSRAPSSGHLTQGPQIPILFLPRPLVHASCPRNNRPCLTSVSQILRIRSSTPLVPPLPRHPWRRLSQRRLPPETVWRSRRTIPSPRSARCLPAPCMISGAPTSPFTWDLRYSRILCIRAKLYRISTCRYGSRTVAASTSTGGGLICSR